jgi:hypothetical protein
MPNTRTMKDCPGPKCGGGRGVLLISSKKSHGTWDKSYFYLEALRNGIVKGLSAQKINQLFNRFAYCRRFPLLDHRSYCTITI